MSRYFQRNVRPGSEMTADQFNETPRRVYGNMSGAGVKMRYSDKAIVQGGGGEGGSGFNGFKYLGEHD